MGEVLQEVKVWNEGYAPGKKSERVFTKLQHFVNQFGQSSPSPKDAVIVFLAYSELVKDMIGTLKRGKAKQRGEEATSSLGALEEGKVGNEDSTSSEFEFSKFDWVDLLCQAFKLIHLEKVDLEAWCRPMESPDKLNRSMDSSSSSFSSSPSQAVVIGADIREKDISRMLQSLDSLRKSKSFLSPNELEERLDGMTAPLIRFIERVRKFKVEAIDEEAFRVVDPGNDRDYLYYKAGSVVASLAKTMRFPVEVETTAFEILHRLACGEDIVAGEVTIAGLTALHLSCKCWSDTYRTGCLKDLITKGYLPELHLTRSLKIPCRATEGESSVTKSTELLIAEVRKRCAAFETRCLAAIGYNFNFEDCSLTLKGGAIDKCGKILKTSETSLRRAKDVIGHESFKFSRLCCVEDRTMLAVTVLSIVRADEREGKKLENSGKSAVTPAKGSAKSPASGGGSEGVRLDEEFLLHMAGRSSVDPSLVHRAAATMYRYKNEALTAMKARHEQEEREREASGEEVEEPGPAPAPALAPRTAPPPPQLDVPQRSNLSRSCSLVTDIPPTLKRTAEQETRGRGLGRGREREEESRRKRQRVAGEEGGEEAPPALSEAEFREAIKVLHAARDAFRKLWGGGSRDKGGQRSGAFLRARDAVLGKWGRVPEALPVRTDNAPVPPLAEIQRLQESVLKRQTTLLRNPTDRCCEAEMALITDDLRSWGYDPYPVRERRGAATTDADRSRYRSKRQPPAFRGNADGSSSGGGYAGRDGRDNKAKRRREGDMNAGTGILSRLGTEFKQGQVLNNVRVRDGGGRAGRRGAKKKGRH